MPALDELFSVSHSYAAGTGYRWLCWEDSERDSDLGSNYYSLENQKLKYSPLKYEHTARTIRPGRKASNLTDKNEIKQKTTFNTVSIQQNRFFYILKI